MPHSPLKKAIGALVLTAYLAAAVGQVPVTFAASFYTVEEKTSGLGLLGKNVKDSRDLVAIVVDEETWDEFDSEIKRYAEDVQRSLPKTNTLIIPTPDRSESVLKLQQVLQKLSLEGEGNASLRGVVIIGDVPLPIVSKNDQSFISLLPYTDFVDPTYVFDGERQQFVRSQSAPAEVKSEVWHGVIRPSKKGEDGKKQLKEFFQKNHRFHSGEPEYSQFQKKIFMNNLVREEEDMNIESFPRYQNFMKNMEDILYSRFTTKWLSELEGSDVKKFNGMPDIQSREPIMKYHLQYPELFGTLFSTYANFVSRSGRWDEDDVESMPSLIAKQDLVAMQTLRGTNDAIETKIDEQLEKIAKKLPLYRDVQIETTLLGKGVPKTYATRFVNNSIIGGRQYVNGTSFEDIVNSQQCSLYGGSTQMVKFLRALNPFTIRVKADPKADPRLMPSVGAVSHMTTIDRAHGAIVDSVFADVPLVKGDLILDIDRHVIDGTQSLDVVLTNYQVGQNVAAHVYRPSISKDITLNFSLVDANDNSYVAGCHGGNYGNLSRCYPKAATTPVGDHAGTLRVNDTSSLGDMDLGRSCTLFTPLKTFADFLEKVTANENPPLPSRDPSKILLIDTLTKKVTLQQFLDFAGYVPPPGANEQQEWDDIQRRFLTPEREQIYSFGDMVVKISPPTKFKDISSTTFHKEPTNETLGAQYQAVVSSALPIDKPRYAEFTDTTGERRKVVYPNAFAASSFEDFVLKLRDTEKLLQIFGAKGVLSDGIDEKKLRDALEWRGLSLEAKHRRMYDFIDESFEAMQFVAHGSPNSYVTNFSGEGLIDEDDPEYLAISDDEAVQGKGKIIAKPGEVTIEKNERGATMKTPLKNSDDESDVVDILKWHTAIQKWLSDLKNSFQPMSLSVNDSVSDKDVKNDDQDGDSEGEDDNVFAKEESSKGRLSIRATSDKKFLAVGSGPSSSATLIFSLIDENGDVARDVSVPVSVRITSKTQQNGAINLSNGKSVKEALVYAQNGVGAVSISSDMTAGPIHFVLCSPGIRCGNFDMTSFGVNSTMNSRSLYVSMLGGSFGKVSEPQYLAGGVLFDGKTQAVSSLTADPREKRRLLSLDAYGSVRLLDAASSVTVRPSGAGEALHVSLSHDLGKTTAGELFIRQQGVSIVPDFVGVAGKAGTFVRLASSDSSYILEKDSSGVLLKEGSRVLARVNSSGGIERFDPRVRLEMGESAKYFSVDIIVGETLAAKSQIQFDAVNSAALLAANPSPLRDLGIGVWLVNQVRGGDVTFVPAYSGFSSNEPMGYALLSNTNIPTGKTTGNDTHMLLMASGATVGEANLPHASEIGIVLGDPTVRFGSRNEASSSGFTRDIGISVGSVASGSDILLPIDVNMDTKRDLLVASRTGEITYFQYVGGSQKFADRGVVINAKHGILDAAVADIDGDSDEDVIVAVKEPCTKNESCVDVYLNQQGLFVRQNMRLKIAEGVRVALLRAVDMNADSRADLLVSLTDGSVYIFYSGKDGIGPYGQLVGNFDIAGSRRVMLTAGIDVTRGASIEIGDGGSDIFPDILAQVEGTSEPFYFVSDPSRSTKGGNVTYVRRAVITPQISQADAAKKLADDLAGAFSPAKNDGSQTKALGVAMDLLTKENGKDADGDGTPDYLDTLPKTLDDIASSVAKTIEKYRCAPGCFPMPLNFAFLAPGQINVNGKPVGYDPGLPVFGAVGSCANWPIWPVCPYTDKAMNFRLYVSPTTTGQIGFGICVGSPYPQNGAQGEPGGKCYAFAPNISLIPKGICKAITSQMNTLLKRAKGFGTGGGFTSFIAGGGDNFTSTDTNNTHTIAGNSSSDLLAPYEAEINVATNIRVPGFPRSFTNWLDRQIEEVTDKLADLPDIIVKYPQLSSFGRAFVPKMDAGKIKSYSTFLAFLNSIPLVTIDPKPVTIVVPTLSSNQIEKFSANLDRFWEDLIMEITRVKNILGCSKAKKGKKGNRYVDLCTLIDVRANKILDRINQNYRTLEEYKNLPVKLIEYRNVETKYVRQIINYMDKMTNFVGGYVKRQQKKLSTWIELTKSIKKSLASWQAVVDLTQKYAKNCDGCKTDRNSLFPMLLSTFVKISEPPVIEFPKWPDIVLDFSRVELGTRITWPDVTFTAKQILLPVLPSPKLPVPPGGDFDAMKMKLDLNRVFDSMIPLLPELPELPVLPKLPDLPPLPVFKLPDLPPVPKIPSLKMIKGVNLSKSLGTIKELLKIVCMIKKGYVVVNENSLKTEIEALTQRSVTPPLELDLADAIQSLSIKYNAVDQILIQGAMKFELQTDAVYKLFKEFAESMNSINADLVGGFNEESKSVEKNLKKLSSWNGEMRYIVQAGQKDGAESVSTARFGDDGDFNKALGAAYSDYAESQAEPTGLYIQNPKTGLPEKLIDYTPPPSSDVHIADSDVDNDNDHDIFYSVGRDIFFKENYTSTVADEFTKFDASGSTVKKLDALLPLAPAVYGITIDDSQANLVSVSWRSFTGDIAGYELVFFNQHGLSRQKYPSASTPPLDLPYGNTYFQIVPLTSHGKRGTPSEVRLLAPQVCGNASAITADLAAPDIFLSDVSMKDGRVSGFTQPARPSQPFSLVRERNGAASALGDYQTDENGNFSVTGLSTDGTTVVKDASGTVIAEYDPDTGGLRAVRDGYRLHETEANQLELLDQYGQVLLRVLRVPDKNGKYVSSKSPTILDSREFAATDILQISPSIESPFSDVPVNSPLYDAVSALEEVDIVEGYRENGKSLFKPDQLISRAEYTKIVLKSLCIEPRTQAYEAPSPFYDIVYKNPLDWFYSFVKESYLRSLITGYLGEKDASGLAPFRPLANISRAEGTKILIEALRMLSIVEFPQDALRADTREPWYVKYLQVAQNLAPFLLKSDDPNLREKFVVTRDEARYADNGLTRGDFALMASRVLNINDCYHDERQELRKKKIQEEEARKKRLQDQRNGDGGNSDGDRLLAEKISKLPPGVYFVLAPCSACPCSVTIDSTSELAAGDSIFAIIYAPDHARILRKSNAILLSKP